MVTLSRQNCRVPSSANSKGFVYNYYTVQSLNSIDVVPILKNRQLHTNSSFNFIFPANIRISLTISVYIRITFNKYESGESNFPFNVSFIYSIFYTSTRYSTLLPNSRSVEYLVEV